MMIYTVSVEKYDLSITEPPFETIQVGKFTYTDQEYEWASKTFGKDCASSVVFRRKVKDMGYWMQFFTSGNEKYAFRVIVWDCQEDYYHYIEEG